MENIGSELEVIQKVSNSEMGTLASGYQLAVNQPTLNDREMISKDALLAGIGSIPVASGIVASLVTSMFLFETPLTLLLAAPVLAVNFIARRRIKTVQRKAAFEEIEKQLGSTVVQFADTPIDNLPQELVNRYQSAAGYHLLMADGRVVRMGLYWERWNISIFHYNVFEKHSVIEQGLAFDSALKSAKAIKE